MQIGIREQQVLEAVDRNFRLRPQTRIENLGPITVREQHIDTEFADSRHHAGQVPELLIAGAAPAATVEDDQHRILEPIRIERIGFTVDAVDSEGGCAVTDSQRLNIIDRRRDTGSGAGDGAYQGQHDETHTKREAITKSHVSGFLLDQFSN